jgi:hypothetical protein
MATSLVMDQVWPRPSSNALSYAKWTTGGTAPRRTRLARPSGTDRSSANLDRGVAVSRTSKSHGEERSVVQVNPDAAFGDILASSAARVVIMPRLQGGT